MRRMAPPLPADLVERLEPGLHADGRGLYLRVQQGGGRSWVFIYHREGRRREMGCGGARRVPLKQARASAAAARALLSVGLDPIEARCMTQGVKANDSICRKHDPLHDERK